VTAYYKVEALSEAKVTLIVDGKQLVVSMIAAVFLIK
jgi:hypothetical protein